MKLNEIFSMTPIEILLDWHWESLRFPLSSTTTFECLACVINALHIFIITVRLVCMTLLLLVGIKVDDGHQIGV